MEMDLRQRCQHLPLAEDRAAVAAAAVTDNPRGVLSRLNVITNLEFLHAFRPADRQHIFSARIYKQWIMRCVDVPRDVSKMLRAAAQEAAIADTMHVPVIGQAEGLPLKSTLSPRGGGAYRLHIHSSIWRKRRIDAGDTVEVLLQLDSEPRDPPLPQDLAGALADEPRALAIFNALTPALRRQIIRYVDQAKHASTREKRVLLIAKRMREREARRKKKKKR